MITKVISGGQTGADQAGLRAAKALGIPTGGMVPRGCRTDDGTALWLLSEYGCTQSSSPDYGPRTIYNIRSAEATIWFGDPNSAGGVLTIGTCVNACRPHVEIPYPCSALDRDRWIARLHMWFSSDVWAPSVINIAGNRERINPGIGEFVERFLHKALV